MQWLLTESHIHMSNISRIQFAGNRHIIDWFIELLKSINENIGTRHRQISQIQHSRNSLQTLAEIDDHINPLQDGLIKWNQPFLLYTNTKMS